MANTKQTKKYLGGWDTSAYDDLSRASRQAYATNWDILKDRFANLMAEADAKQQEAVRNYNNTLADQTNSTFNAQRAIDQNLANRGLAESGVRNLINQEQTRAIGGSTNTALGKLMNRTSDVVNAQISGLNDLVSGGNKLNEKQLSDQLDILADKQAADMEGQRLAAQLAEQEAARASGGRGGSSAQDEENDEKYRELAIWALLNNLNPETGEAIDISDGEKGFILNTMYGVPNAQDVIKGFESKILGKTVDDTTTKEYKQLNKTSNLLDNYNKQLATLQQNGISNPAYGNFSRNYPNFNGNLATQIQTLEDKIRKTQGKYNEQLLKYQNTPEYLEKNALEKFKDMTLEDYYNIMYGKK